MADHVLVIQDSSHTHTAENVALTSTHILTVADCSHGHEATSYELSVPGVIRVNQWTPADADIEVNQGATVQVDFEAAFTEELEQLYDEGQEFIDGGTLTNAEVVVDALQLATSVTAEDFEVPRHSDGADITASNHWTKRSDNGICVIDDAIPSETNQYAKYQQYNQGGLWSFDDFGSAEADVDLEARVRWEDDNGDICLVARVTGSSSSTRGYVFRARAHGNQVSLARLTGGSGGVGQFGFTATAFTINADTWYRLRFRVVGTWLGGKIWEDGSPEPGSWTTTYSDSTHAGPGDVGLCFISGVANAIKYADDFTGETVPPVYEAAGSWLSDVLELASVNRYSTSRITWDETTPAGTSVTVETRKDGGSWQACSNGGEIPGFTYDEFLGIGTELEVRVSLATTDDAATPTVENLRLYFDPCNFADLELIVDSITATEANGRLFTWGKGVVVGGTELEAWNDLHADAAGLGWYNHPGAGTTVSAELRYNGVSIDSIAFSGDTIPINENIGAWLYYSFPALPLSSSPFDNVFEWTAGDHDINTGRVYEFTIIDKGVNLRADAYYYVGHPVSLDVPSSLLVALAALDDHLSSSVIEGYRRDDNPSSSLAQARRRDDFPSSLLPALEALDDFISATVVAIDRIDDQPSSLVVYGVNRDNVIEVHVISESTYTALTGEGFTWN